jgi:CheY-like chemotaxis protein
MTLAEPVNTAVTPRVLVIDDERPIREMFRDFLQVLGCQPDCVASGPEALAQFAPGRYDLVLTDFVMPELSGLEVAAAIRGRDRAVPIVMITGSTANLSGGLAALDVVLLHKPITFEIFKAAIHRALPSRRRSSSGA